MGKPENKSFAIVVRNSSWETKKHTYLSCCCTQYTTPTWTKRIERKTLIFFISSFVCDFSSWIFFSTSTFVRAQHLRLLGGLRIIYQLSLSKLRGEGELEWSACSSDDDFMSWREKNERAKKKLEIEQNYTFNMMFDISCEKENSEGFFLI